MALQSGRRVLVLGGIRSGKSELAEALAASGESVRYVATAGTATVGDAEWAARIAAHRQRRPAHWGTEETGGDPARLVALLCEAKPDEVLLVDDLGGWLTALLDTTAGWATPGAAESLAAPAEALAAAVRDCAAARLVLVSPEVGLSVVPATGAGRLFADALGSLNQAVAQACDAVALVVAAQPYWLKGTDPRSAVVPAAAARAAAPGPDAVTATAPAGAVAAFAAPPPTAAAGATPFTTGGPLPMPDAVAANAARHRLDRLDLPGTGLGGLTPLIGFAAAAQQRDTPTAWQSVRLMLLHADHDGDVAAGDPVAASTQRLARAEAGEGPLALLAGAAGVTVESVRCGRPAAAIETRDAMSPEAVDAALAYGWQLANLAVDGGTDALLLASCGAGAQTAAVAVIASVTDSEPSALLPRVPAPGGRIDDAAWMARCAAIRDAAHRARRANHRSPAEVLTTIGGPDLAVATGLLLGAAARRTPVLLDGPVGLAAALLARDLGAEIRYWLLLVDDGGHPAVKLAAATLGLTPLLDLRLGLGEGAAALAALPLLRAALTIAGTATLQDG